jgi:sugar transferase (PEP-CTERM system associated)
VEVGKIVRLNGSLVEYTKQNMIDEIVVAVDDRRRRLPLEEILDCKMSGVHICDLATFFERETGKIKLDIINMSWLIFSDGFLVGSGRDIVKRTFDILSSLAVLAVTWPLVIGTALAVWLEARGRGPIFYKQIRTGQNGAPFNVIKFRSMRTDAEKDGVARWATANDNRVTRVGKFIRKTRLDELPQLFNVLRGDMSFVGPRPERPEFVKQLSASIPYYAERHRVKPGVTGWAQVCYPYGASEQDAFEKLQYDLYYVKNFSLFMDLMILLQTAEVVLWGKGAR